MRIKLLFTFLLLFIAMTGAATNDNFAGDNGPINQQSRVFQAQTIISLHKVDKGETLYSIARRNDVSVDNLKKWNDLESDRILVGAELKIQKLEFVLIEEPELKEPELAEITIDENVTKDIMGDYILKVKDEIEIAGISDEKIILPQEILYAEKNRYSK